jgi:hypothetical protein
MLQPYFASNAPGGFHGGGSLAGNDSSELFSTMSSDSDSFKLQRLEHKLQRLEHNRTTAAAAAMHANPTAYFRRLVSGCISLDTRRLFERKRGLEIYRSLSVPAIGRNREHEK